MIPIEDFKKIEIRAGKILSAEKVPDTDKLIKLSVDLAEPTPRQIISGIALHFPDVTVLIGKTCMFVTNLEPRTIRGLESNGMILAISVPPSESNPAGGFSLLEPNNSILPGTRAS